MTILSLTALLFAGFVLLTLINFLRSLRKRVGVLPAWRVTQFGIRCFDCGVMLQSGREPFARGLCPICKTDSYHL